MLGGVPLDPQVAAMRERRMAAATPQLSPLTLAAPRAADLADIRAAAGTGEPVHSVTEHQIPGPLTLRIYRPEGDRPQPALVYFFGGGWTLGAIDTADAIARSLANAVPCTVVVPGYRLAPEHRFPAAVEDCHAATRWVAEHAAQIGVDPSRLAVGGDSAGGNLAAAVTLLCRDGGGPALAAQLLVYPNTLHGADTPSMRDKADPLLFNHHSVDWYWTHYLADPADGADPLASPLRAPDLSGLPPALVITAEYDPLRDEGEAYARRLAESGIDVELTCYPGMVHGFFTMTGAVDAARTAVEQAAAGLRRWFEA